MLFVLKDLASFTVEAGRAAMEGANGRLEIEARGPGLVSVLYRPDPSLFPGAAAEPLPQLLDEGFAASGGPPWDSARETAGGFELRLGPTRVLVDRATARVDVYEGGTLAHGGPIGDKDLVAPGYPLRAQAGGAGRALEAAFSFRLEEGDSFFGLGEKSGPLDKRGRSFRMYNRDALAYDARYSDPLYKSVPFLVKANRGTGAMCGIYFPCARVEEVNLGVESRFYYAVSLADGPLGYFVMTGGGYRGILANYRRVAGACALPPLFSFGYLASSMGYTDPDDAPDRVLAFFKRAEEEDIPCEGMYFSSGYVKARNGERYTFAWNREKFPDPAGFIGALRERGYRVCCNVKPGILTTHPWYADAAEAGAFVPDGQGRPLVSYYWGNDASLVDFSRKEGRDWWAGNLTKHILDLGVSGVWNDNNEFEAEDESLPMQAFKSLLPVLMAKASYDAMRRCRPGKRPWNISRAGYAGLQRYARTWTGDNVADWDTMRSNVAMGMNLGLSGLPIYGHDLGGFVGPNPDEELLLRWCQGALFQPRFVMHSWKPDGWITEPWSYPGSLPAMRRFIRERYRFLPYIYDLAIRAAETGLPLESPIALEFPGDPALGLDSLDRMAGDAILVPAPPERGEVSGRLRLPAGADWYDPEEGTLVRGGAIHEFDYPPDLPRYFLRCGSVVPTASVVRAVGKGPTRDYRFELLPPAGSAAPDCVHSEDDGESDFVPGSHWRYRMALEPGDGDRCRFVARLERRAREPEFGRVWRFRVPPGFSILDAEGRPAGAEIELRLGTAPERIDFEIEGRYRRARP